MVLVRFLVCCCSVPLICGFSEVTRAHQKLWVADMTSYEDQFKDLESCDREILWLLHDGRKHLAYLLGKITAKFKDQDGSGEI